MSAKAYSASSWFLSVQQDTDGRVVVLRHDVLSIPSDASVELAEIFVAESHHLHFHQYMTFGGSVVEDEIDEEMILADQNVHLLVLEAKSMTQFEREIL